LVFYISKIWLRLRLKGQDFWSLHGDNDDYINYICLQCFSILKTMMKLEKTI